MIAEDVKTRDELDNFRSDPRNFTTKLLDIEDVLKKAKEDLRITNYFSGSSSINSTIELGLKETDVRIDSTFKALKDIESTLKEVESHSTYGLMRDPLNQLEKIRKEIVMLFCFSLLTSHVSNLRHKQADKLMHRIQDQGMNNAKLQDVKEAQQYLLDQNVELMHTLSQNPKKEVDDAVKRHAKRGGYGE